MAEKMARKSTEKILILGIVFNVFLTSFYLMPGPLPNHFKHDTCSGNRGV
jgi:hypothetical protein